jgi:hypothetical protein
MLIFFGINLVVWSCGWYLIEERIERKGSFRRDMRKLWDRMRGIRRRRLADVTTASVAEKDDQSAGHAEVAEARSPGFLQGLERSSVFWCLITSVFISTL